ncbi:GntR family transcriptional regulator [Luteococcus peritonei]|uniref:GntR family transcriptional regulator n=1 Tax=Luteococcus peritonei TaxID=88874 RepID=A0ABW4RXV5_9ACTN
MTPPIAAVNRLTLREQVLKALRTAITSGEIPAGADLVETELADSYQVSRGTVREALRTLQQAGLVEGDARGRLRVHQPSPQEVRELFMVRAALETLAVREIAAAPDRDERLARLREVLPPEQAKNFLTALDLDLAFHERLCELSGNATLLELWRGLESRMRIVLCTGAEGEPLPLMSGTHHLPFLDSIGDPNAHEPHLVVFGHMQQAAGHWADEVVADD